MTTRIRIGREWDTGRTTSPFYATWPSTPCKKKDRRAHCAESSSAQDGMMTTSTAYWSYFEMRLPCNNSIVTLTLRSFGAEYVAELQARFGPRKPCPTFQGGLLATPAFIRVALAVCFTLPLVHAQAQDS